MSEHKTQSGTRSPRWWARFIRKEQHIQEMAELQARHTAELRDAFLRRDQDSKSKNAEPVRGMRIAAVAYATYELRLVELRRANEAVRLYRLKQTQTAQQVAQQHIQLQENERLLAFLRAQLSRTQAEQQQARLRHNADRLFWTREYEDLYARFEQAQQASAILVSQVRHAARQEMKELEAHLQHCYERFARPLTPVRAHDNECTGTVVDDEDVVESEEEEEQTEEELARAQVPTPSSASFWRPNHQVERVCQYLRECAQSHTPTTPSTPPLPPPPPLPPHPTAFERLFRYETAQRRGLNKRQRFTGANRSSIHQ